MGLCLLSPSFPLIWKMAPTLFLLLTKWNTMGSDIQVREAVMDYSKMTDFEINMKVAELCLDYDSISQFPHIGASVHWGDGANWHNYNPCNNPADAWPIIVNNLITLRPVALYVGGHRWFATQGEGDFGMKYADDNPLRSAMIVFLMMQESANVQDNPAR